MIDAKTVIDALALPANTRLDQRIQKKLLLDQVATNTADKQKIRDGIDSLHWIAAIKSDNVTIPPFRDKTREYLELAVIHAVLRPDAKISRLTALLHRAIPYPMVLIVSNGDEIAFSLVHKRFSQGEDGQVVLDGEIVQETLLDSDGLDAEFLTSLVLSEQDADNLFRLYQGWLERLTALAAARLCGFFLPLSGQENETRIAALTAHTQTTKKLTTLCTKVKKEKQLKRRVELNLEISNMQDKLEQLVAELDG